MQTPVAEIKKKNVFVLVPAFPCQFKAAVNYMLDSGKFNVLGLTNETDADYLRFNIRTLNENFQLIPNLPVTYPIIESAVIAYSLELTKLKQQNNIPDLILAHVGSGMESLISDIFPGVPLIGYYEWYSDYKLSKEPLSIATNHYHNYYLHNFIKNSSVVVTPTRLQRKQFPSDIQHRMMILHEGIDTSFYKPTREIITKDKKVITYVSRGLEPRRAFLQFIKIMNLVLQIDSNIVVKIIGNDKMYYKEEGFSEISYKQEAIRILTEGGTIDKVQFMDAQTNAVTLKTLQESDLHIYFSIVAIPSWSFLEALSTGCVVLTSNTGVVDEFYWKDKPNFFFTDHDNYFSSRDTVLKLLYTDNSQTRRNAREYMLRNYNNTMCERKWGDLIESLL
uniref:Glycosyl transferase family 1 domain-containing protein n=1 Tax=viral metagenome TaxID=1070528 RepID=A0A6C0DSV4_9ZZZZ